jgi:hypothetical protein
MLVEGVCHGLEKKAHQRMESILSIMNVLIPHKHSQQSNQCSP